MVPAAFREFLDSQRVPGAIIGIVSGTGNGDFDTLYVSIFGEVFYINDFLFEINLNIFYSFEAEDRFSYQISAVVTPHRFNTYGRAPEVLILFTTEDGEETRCQSQNYDFIYLHRNEKAVIVGDGFPG